MSEFAQGVLIGLAFGMVMGALVGIMAAAIFNAASRGDRQP